LLSDKNQKVLIVGCAAGEGSLLPTTALLQLKAELSAVEASWSDDVTELEMSWRQVEDVRRRQLELMIDADDERQQVSHVTSPLYYIIL